MWQLGESLAPPPHTHGGEVGGNTLLLLLESVLPEGEKKRGWWRRRQRPLRSPIPQIESPGSAGDVSVRPSLNLPRPRPPSLVWCGIPGRPGRRTRHFRTEPPLQPNSPPSARAPFSCPVVGPAPGRGHAPPRAPQPIGGPLSAGWWVINEGRAPIGRGVPAEGWAAGVGCSRGGRRHPRPRRRPERRHVPGCRGGAVRGAVLLSRGRPGVRPRTRVGGRGCPRRGGRHAGAPGR